MNFKNILYDFCSIIDTYVTTPTFSFAELILENLLAILIGSVFILIVGFLIGQIFAQSILIGCIVTVTFIIACLLISARLYKNSYEEQHPPPPKFYSRSEFYDEKTKTKIPYNEAVSSKLFQNPNDYITDMKFSSSEVQYLGEGTIIYMNGVENILPEPSLFFRRTSKENKGINNETNSSSNL